MTVAHITIPDMLADFEMRIRVVEARLENVLNSPPADSEAVERHQARLRMLRAQAAAIAGPQMYPTEGGRP